MRNAAGNVYKIAGSDAQHQLLLNRGFIDVDGSATVTDAAYVAKIDAEIVYGIGAVGDSGNIAAQISSDSTNITTPEQFETANWIDQKSTKYTDVSFVPTIPDVADATVMTIYIDAKGVAKYKATTESTEMTPLEVR